MKASSRKLIHEVWEDLEVDGQWSPGVCLAGPRGATFRASLSGSARMLGRIDAASHFEAMTKYHQFLNREPYSTNEEWDMRPYPEEWFDEQADA